MSHIRRSGIQAVTLFGQPISVSGRLIILRMTIDTTLAQQGY
jgi:hypothetical protein